MGEFRFICLRIETTKGSFEPYFGSIKGGDLLDQLSDC
jgi:hypothetical protein